MKIRPVEAELFHADGRTDMTKLTVAFCNFANVPEKRISSVNCLVIPITATYVFVRHVIPHTCVS